jgi:hypothetical protein
MNKRNLIEFGSMLLAGIGWRDTSIMVYYIINISVGEMTGPSTSFSGTSRFEEGLNQHCTLYFTDSYAFKSKAVNYR